MVLFDSDRTAEPAPHSLDEASSGSESSLEVDSSEEKPIPVETATAKKLALSTSFPSHGEPSGSATAGASTGVPSTVGTGEGYCLVNLASLSEELQMCRCNECGSRLRSTQGEWRCLEALQAQLKEAEGKVIKGILHEDTIDILAGMYHLFVLNMGNDDDGIT